MRHDSALKVIAFLRENLGRPVSILEICRHIDLSYQPTHGHVRELEELGVILTERRGRQVCCALHNSDAAAIWLALESERRWRGITGRKRRLGEALRGELAPTLRSKLLSLIVAVGASDSYPAVWPLVSEPSARRQAQEISSRVGACWRGPLQVTVGTADDLLQWLQEPAQTHRFLTSALPIYGRERFWELMLAGPPSEPPLPPPAPPAQRDFPPPWEDDFID